MCTAWVRKHLVRCQFSNLQGNLEAQVIVAVRGMRLDNAPTTTGSHKAGAAFYTMFGGVSGRMRSTVWGITSR